jgi:hypothetical protein
MDEVAVGDVMGHKVPEKVNGNLKLLINPQVISIL